MSTSFAWAGSSGDSWAERWRQLDRALVEVGDALIASVLEAAPSWAFDAFDIGSGAGATSIALVSSRPDARVTGCDLSPALVQVAQARSVGLPSLQFIVGDAVEMASEHREIDLFLSRHGVMFFPDPPTAFRSFRNSATDGADLIFTCFSAWDENPWASQLASAAADRKLPAPSREPGGFAFADPAYVNALLSSAGWVQSEPEPVSFKYVAGEGDRKVEEALDLLSQIGPASAVLRELEPEDWPSAIERMRRVIELYSDGDAVRFPGAVWIWRARADGVSA